MAAADLGFGWFWDSGTVIWSLMALPSFLKGC